MHLSVNEMLCSAASLDVLDVMNDPENQKELKSFVKKGATYCQ